MKHLLLKTAVALVLTSSSVWAEIYETTDSDGNKVFTDTPTGAAEVVDLPEANIADGVKTRPAPPAASAAPARSVPPAGSQGSQTANDDDDGVYIIGNQYNNRAEEAAARERRHEVIDRKGPGEGDQGEVIHHKQHPVATPHRAVKRR